MISAQALAHARFVSRASSFKEVHNANAVTLLISCHSRVSLAAATEPAQPVSKAICKEAVVPARFHALPDSTSIAHLHPAVHALPHALHVTAQVRQPASPVRRIGTWRLAQTRTSRQAGAFLKPMLEQVLQ